MKAFGGRGTADLPPRELDFPAGLPSGAGVAELRGLEDCWGLGKDPGDSPVWTREGTRQMRNSSDS
jgi:hypothetical protein